MTISDSVCDTGKMSEHKESDEDISSSISISTLNSKDMVIMTAADLIVLCKWLIVSYQSSSSLSSPPSSPPSAKSDEDSKVLAHKYQKKMQVSLNIKFITTLNSINYQAWKIMILSDIKMISGVDILNKNQQKSSEDLSSLEN
ncbi:conserved hypothetical protein [Histoplasma capsulatum H143]|uniref:Uncharacterized protein n=1 Tax=Ajellomyces capsulatus (strain H143) TaxID=544712 RepID=C6HQL5_AJECH|nr:conserved hypothetical protein [Histoplasma capsulatum H143]